MPKPPSKRQTPLIPYVPHFPKVTDAMRKRCAERNVHVWDLVMKPKTGRCIACGTTEEEAAQLGPPEWRVPHAA